MARQRSCRRGDDDRIARVDPFVRVWEQLCLAGESVGDVAPLEGAAAAQHPAPAFARDVLHRRDRALAAVVGRRDIDIDPLRVHRAARERHVALTADQRADAPAWRVDGFQAGGVAEAPDHALGLVGMTVRCRFKSAPSGPIVTTVVHSVAPLKSVPRSWAPHTKLNWRALAASGSDG